MGRRKSASTPSLKWLAMRHQPVMAGHGHHHPASGWGSRRRRRYHGGDHRTGGGIRTDDERADGGKGAYTTTMGRMQEVRPTMAPPWRAPE